MNKKIYIYPFLISLVAVSGCTKEDMPQSPSEIHYRERIFNIQSNLPTVTVSRATAVDEKTLNSCWATCFNHTAKTLGQSPKDPYFENEEFDTDNTSSGTKRFTPIHPLKCQAPDEGGNFEFYALFPSLREMSDKSGVVYFGDETEENAGKGYYKLHNESTASTDSTTVNIRYSIARFKVAKDISK